MNTRFWSMVLLATMVAPAVVNAKSGGRIAWMSEPDSRVEIRLHDHAQVPEATLKAARRHVASILKASGVEVIWHRCAPCAVNREKAPACGTPRTAWTLVLRVLPEKMSKRIFEDREVYGRALAGDDRDFGYLADVFYNRIEELAVRTGSPDSLLLGAFIAHEIGHLLLGVDSHSESGIMSVPFDDLQVRRAVEGNLRFTHSEAKRIRTDVRRRWAAGAAQDS